MSRWNSAGKMITSETAPPDLRFEVVLHEALWNPVQPAKSQQICFHKMLQNPSCYETLKTFTETTTASTPPPAPPGPLRPPDATTPPPLPSTAQTCRRTRSNGRPRCSQPSGELISSHRARTSTCLPSPTVPAAAQQ